MLPLSLHEPPTIPQKLVVRRRYTQTNDIVRGLRGTHGRGAPAEEGDVHMRVTKPAKNIIRLRAYVLHALHCYNNSSTAAAV